MVQLGWSEGERAEERGRWLRGEVDAAEWLRTYVSAKRQTWSEEASTALQYLEGRVDRMRYPSYKARG